MTQCISVLGGGPCDSDFIVTLGGPPTVGLLHDGMRPGQEYWLRVWAARGLLWAGPGDDAVPLRAALTDESWRVREMTCKVIARHCVGDLLADVAGLSGDPVPRVAPLPPPVLSRESWNTMPSVTS